MKLIATILFLLAFKVVLCQGNAVNWITVGDVGVNNYEVQQSYDGHNWMKIAVLPAIGNDNNVYKYPISQTGIFYRIAANMDGMVYYSDSILLPSTLSVNLVNVLVKNNVLQWENDDENGLDYYSVLMSTNGVDFIEISKVPADGRKQYKLIVK